MTRKRPIKSYPTTHLGWYEWYAKLYDSTHEPAVATLAMYYLFLHLRDNPNETP